MAGRLVDVRVDSKRRVSLPASFLEGIPASARLIAHVEAPGRFVIQTPEAAVEAAAARIRGAVDRAAASVPAAADVRAMRDEDARLSDVQAKARSDANDGPDTGAGARLLAALGLPDV